MRMKVAKNLTMVRTGGWNQSRRTPPATRPRGLTLILGLEKKICTFYFVVKVYMFDISWCRWCSREYNLTWTTWTTGILLSVTESIDAQALYKQKQTFHFWMKCEIHFQGCRPPPNCQIEPSHSHDGKTSILDNVPVEGGRMMVL